MLYPKIDNMHPRNYGALHTISIADVLRAIDNESLDDIVEEIKWQKHEREYIPVAAAFVRIAKGLTTVNPDYGS